MTLYPFSLCVHRAGDALGSVSGHASRDGPELGFCLCVVAKSRLPCSMYLCGRMNQVPSFKGITPLLFKKKPFQDVMSAYDAHIHKDWIGDLRTSCYPVIVQHKHRVEWQ